MAKTLNNLKKELENISHSLKAQLHAWEAIPKVFVS